jgi:hypothetical protein
LNVLSFSTYNFHLLRTWMYPVQFFIFIFFVSFTTPFPICSLVFLVVVLTSVSTYILYLPFSLPAFDVNGQASLILVYYIIYYILISY